MYKISESLIYRLSSGPSDATESDLRVTRDNIIDLLSVEYNVFLQGSYKNDTAISSINDIDIVAVRKNPIMSLLFRWEQVFDDLIYKIGSYHQYKNAISKGKKCIKLNLSQKRIDIVPAIYSYENTNKFCEPIRIFNRETQLEVLNYPKTHYENGCIKNRNTNQKYKKCVRLLKNFIKNNNIKHVAPSFYVECLIYSYPESWFQEELILCFYKIVNHLCNAADFNFSFTTISGDKTVISDREWSINNFLQFRNFTRQKISYLLNALNSNNQLTADQYFKNFFNMQ